MSELVIHNVSVWFEDRQRGRVLAVDDISASIADGEFVCIVGPSGCGKSTLLNVVGGLVHANTGEVLVDGRPVTGPGPDRGMVFQSYTLYPWLTVRANIEFGLKLGKIPARERRRISDRLIELVRLDGFTEAYPKALSGGMRQRVAIARALANDPVLILADEPTGNLDTKNAAAVFDSFARLTAEEGRTVLVVTHDAELAARAGRRVHLVDGRIVSDGPARPE